MPNAGEDYGSIALRKELQGKLFKLYQDFVRFRISVYFMFSGKCESMAKVDAELTPSRTAFDEWAEQVEVGRYEYVHSAGAKGALRAYEAIHNGTSEVPERASLWKGKIVELPEFALLIFLADWESALPKMPGQHSGTALGGVRGSDGWETNMIKEGHNGILKFKSGELAQLATTCYCKTKTFCDKWQGRDTGLPFAEAREKEVYPGDVAHILGGVLCEFAKGLSDQGEDNDDIQTAMSLLSAQSSVSQSNTGESDTFNTTKASEKATTSPETTSAGPGNQTISDAGLLSNATLSSGQGPTPM